jgi:hypothetical protein
MAVVPPHVKNSKLEASTLPNYEPCPNLNFAVSKLQTCPILNRRNPAKGATLAARGGNIRVNATVAREAMDFGVENNLMFAELKRRVCLCPK